MKRPTMLTLLAALVLVMVAACGPEGTTADESTPGTPVADGKADGINSTSDSHLVDIPFYFGVPKSVVSVPLNRPAYPYPTVWNGSQEVDSVGLRMIAVKQTNVSVAAKQEARRGMAASLGKAGVLQDGDVALSFRPELANTMAYPHIQMGSTHAGLVYTIDGVAYNLDSPLDSSYVGQFDTSHYAGNGTTDMGTDALHILRPRNMTETRRVQLREWVRTLKSNLDGINGDRAQIKFQGDYMKPIFLATGWTTRQTVTKLGQIILEEDTSTKLPMYCAEFVWHMIALSNCTASDIRNAPADGAECVDAPFAPMAMVRDMDDTIPGLAEGPLLAVLQAPADDQRTLINTVFVEGNPTRLSPGHRDVSTKVAPLMPSLAEYFQARVTGDAETINAKAAFLNGAVSTNYSPTAFLVNAMNDTRTVDYVTTVVFVSPTGYSKAQALARNPVP